MASRRPTARRNTTRASQQPAPSWVPAAFAFGGLVLGLLLTIYGLPGFALTWLMVVVAAWAAMPPTMSGRDPITKNPTPQGQREVREYAHFLFWMRLKWGITLPATSLVPGWPVYAATLAGVWAAAAVGTLPHRALPHMYPQHLLASVDAASAYFLVTQIARARRETVERTERSPGVRVNALSLVNRRWLAVSAATGASAAIAAAVRFSATGGDPGLTIVRSLLLGSAVTGALVARAWVDASLGHWRVVLAARDEWAPRWAALKHVDAPRLCDRQTLGPATIDSFTAAASMGSRSYIGLSPKIVQTFGRPVNVFVLPEPMVDPGTGEPIPGSTDANAFRVVSIPVEVEVDLGDPQVDEGLARLWMQCALVALTEDSGAPVVIDEMHVLNATNAGAEATTPEADAERLFPSADRDAVATPLRATAERLVWRVTAFMPGGPGYEGARRSLIGPLAAMLGSVEVLADHRSNGGDPATGLGPRTPAFYVGDLTGGTPPLDASYGVDAKHLNDLAEEDEWVIKWGAALKRDANPPTIRPDLFAEQALADGTRLCRQGFVVRAGDLVSEYFDSVDRLAATFAGSPLVSVSGWHSGQRPGERHPQAFQVMWAEPNGRGLSTPAQLAPFGSGSHRGPNSEQAPRLNDAYLWLLTGLTIRAFRASKMAQPEIFDVACLTQATSREHIWRIDIRLYDGVTLDAVRKNTERLRIAFGCDWLRVDDHEQGCAIYVGTDPGSVSRPNAACRLARQELWQTVTRLNWSAAFGDAKVSSPDGRTPSLLEVSTLPRNAKVEVSRFALPSGLSLTQIKQAASPLCASTKNAWIDIRKIPGGVADECLVLTCTENPIPGLAPVQWDEFENAAPTIPFATNIGGEPVTFDSRLDPHLLISGQSGAGKSVTLQTLIFGAAVQGWDLYIVDPSKGAVDFNFAEPWARGIGRTVWEAKAVIEAVYAEVSARKAINAQYSCGNYRDLPEEVRYPHVLVVLDEFTSLMIPEPLAKPTSDDPTILAEYEVALRTNEARAYIGTYVGKIVREARSTGFTVLLATQALKADTLKKIPASNDLKDNMSRMIIGRASFGQMAAALKMPQDAPATDDDVPPGRGLYEGNGRAAEVVQMWFEASQATFASRLAEIRPPLAESDRLDVSRCGPPDPDVSGQIITGQIIPIGGPTAPGVIVSRPVEVIVEEVSLDLAELERYLDEESAGRDEVEDRPSVDVSHGLVETESRPIEPEPDWDSVLAVLDEADDADGVELTDVLPGTDAPVGEYEVTEQISWDVIDPSEWMPEESEFGLVEIDALVAFLADFPEVRTVTWSDPALDELTPIGLTLRELTADLLQERGVVLLPPASSGLAAEALAADDEFATEAPTIPSWLLDRSDSF